MHSTRHHYYCSNDINNLKFTPQVAICSPKFIITQAHSIFQRYQPFFLIIFVICHANTTCGFLNLFNTTQPGCSLFKHCLLLLLCARYFSNETDTNYSKASCARHIISQASITYHNHVPCTLTFSFVSTHFIFWSVQEFGW